jgi:PKD repeat protein
MDHRAAAAYLCSMKTLTLSLCLALAMGGSAAADPRAAIAFDFCYLDWNEAPYLFCNVYVADADGPAVHVVTAGVRPVWSPDGSKIAFSRGIDGGGIGIVNLGDGLITDVGAGLEFTWALAWSPDGSRIALDGLPPDGSWGLYVTNVDGSGLARIADAGYPDGGPSWSPDGARIAFNCTVEGANPDICTVKPDGTDRVRLTDDLSYDAAPAFSPDGSRIAFTTQRYGVLPAIAVMNADGSDVTRLGNLDGQSPDWSFDGSRIAYALPYFGACDADQLCYDTLHVVDADGTGDRELGGGSSPSWRTSAEPMGPVAAFSHACDYLTCNFASDSWDFDGTITTYDWDFGDGATASGFAAVHAYAAPGSYVATLTVADDTGRVGTAAQTVVVSLPPAFPPIVSLQGGCDELDCSFNGSGSRDPDGVIVSYAWTFGDGSSGLGHTVTHTYAAPGTYAVTLTVTDDDGLSTSETRNQTTWITRAHAGDLDGRSAQQPGKWTAYVTITAHDTVHTLVENAAVTGSWSVGGTGACTTDGAGQCTFARSAIPNSVSEVTFTVTGVTRLQLTYYPASNHDPDGDSGGSGITVRRR